MTFEEIDLLVRRANPVPVRSVPAPLPSAGEDHVRGGTAMQIEDLDSTASIQRRPGGRLPSGPIAVAAAALVIVVALVAVSTITGGDDSSDTAAPDMSPAAVADAFVASLADYDAAEALSYLRDDGLAEAAGAAGRLHYGPGAVGLASDLRWREVTGFQWFFDPCEEVDGDSGSDHSTLRCPFAYHGIHSEEQGHEPYEGSTYRIVVRDGRIHGFTEQIDCLGNGFNDEVWVPFLQWLVANHPDDVSVMYPDGRGASRHSTTDESIDLWERRSREYVDATR
jgi:hypothetical protein